MRHQARFPRTALTVLAFSAVALNMQADQGIPEITSFEPTPLEKKIFDGPGVTVTSGEEIYSTLCAGCHMPKGEGAVGGGMYPALAGNDKLEYPDYAVFIVLNGYKAMPSFAHTLSDEQVAAGVNYLQSGLAENSYESAATVEQVELSRPQ